MKSRPSFRPILAENCFACHGPDSAARKADLRIDRRDDAVKSGAITPGNLKESKLVDRLFRPDMSLGNSAQNKKFIADRTSINKQATVGTFYVQKKSDSKNFTGTRDFSARQFDSQPFRGQRSASGISSQQALGNSRAAYATQTARGLRNAPQSDKKVVSRSYAENRPFLDKGKSQKALARKNKPLTIEEVRELLNKNK